MIAKISRTVATVAYAAALLTACAAPARDAGGDSREHASDTDSDSLRQAFGRTAIEHLLDTTLYELRATVVMKVPNTNPNDPESPLAEQPLVHAAEPGPHTLDGKLYAELGALQAALGRGPAVQVEDDKVFIGSPPVLLVGHMHGDALYVPVKLFARQFGAYVDIGCTFANCAAIWTPSVIEHMRKENAIGGAGMLEGYAEGIVKGIDVRRLPGG